MGSGVARLTKREWYKLGGFANSALFRRDRGRGWSYFLDVTHPQAQGIAR